MKTVRRNCPCGAEFEVKFASEKKKYCSVECRRKYTPKVTRGLVCKRCGVAFTFNGRSRCWYCPDCRKKVNVEKVLRHREKVGLLQKRGVGSGGNQKGNKNTLKRRYSEVPTPVLPTNYRRRCLELWDPLCVMCGERSYVEVHHVDGDPKNFDTSNLIPACRKCRRAVHRVSKAADISIEEALFVKWKDGRIKIAEKTGTPRGGQPEVKARASRND